MRIRTIVSTAAALLLFGCCSTQPKPENNPPKTNQIQSNMGGSCAGFGNIECGEGLECYLDADAKKMDDANGICREKRALIGEECGTIANVQCESSAFCKRPDGFDQKGICVQSPN